MEEGAVVRNSGNDAYGDPEVLNSQGSGHLLILFWTRSKWKFDSKRRKYYERAIDPNEYHITGCDDDHRRKLLLYRSHFLGSTIRSCNTCRGVIERVLMDRKSEMSPDICFYSEDEYPHKDFALSCGVRSSFCFPSTGSAKFSVMEIVSTCNQDFETLKKFCQSIKGLYWSLSFPNINVQKYAAPEIDHLLEVVSQKFQLPLTQYWKCEGCIPYLVRQFSYGVFENSAPWSRFKDACFHKGLRVGEGPLGSSFKEPGAFFCKDITALSITLYPFAHYAQNCGSIACFTMYLSNISQLYEEWILEFFLPAQERDNDYPLTSLNFIWTKVKELKECLPNLVLASGEQLGQELSVKVINSSIHNKPEFFKIGQHDSSPPHLKRSLNLFENGTGQRSNSYSCEEAATGEPSKRVPTEVFQPRTSEEHFEIRGNTVAAERADGPVEESTLEYTPRVTSDVDVGCTASNVDIRNAMTTTSQPFRFQTMKNTTQQEEETMILDNEGDTSLQLPHISQPLFKCGVEQDEQVLLMKKRPLNMYLYEEIPTGTPSKRTPGDVEQIISLNELDQCIEPQSLTSQPSGSRKIIRDEGYTVASDSETGCTSDELVEVSRDEDLEYAKTNVSQSLNISETSFTLENIRKHFGRPQKDVAKSFGVSLSTFKRNCRLVGITRWQPGKRKFIDNETGQRKFSAGIPHTRDTPSVAHTGQESNNMDVKVMYNGVPVRFEIPTSSGITELENNVIERLPLTRKSFSIKYQDDEGDWVLIACDKDVQKCLEISRSLKKTTIKMLLDPPVT